MTLALLASSLALAFSGCVANVTAIPAARQMNAEGTVHACDEVGPLMQRDGVIYPDVRDRLSVCVHAPTERF